MTEIQLQPIYHERIETVLRFIRNNLDQPLERKALTMYCFTASSILTVET